MIGDFLTRMAADQPLLFAFTKVMLVVGAILSLVPVLIWWERRLLSWMQDRLGPNRTGTVTIPDSFPIEKLRGKKVKLLWGLIQPIADGVKLFLKEDVTPSMIDRKIYFIAPAIALFPAFALGATVPWGPSTGLYGLLTPIADVEIGILYVLAISSLGAYGVVLAGFASNNKYSLMGGLRASAQLISYELAMAMAVAAVVFASGSMRLTEVVRNQEAPLWGWLPAVDNWFILTPWGFLAAVIFLIALIAETNRAPFDLPEAENELIAGYHTEYSSMKFAVFFMGEYAAMFVFSGVFAVLFLGGYNILPIDWAFMAQAFPGAAGFFRFIESANYWLAPVTFLLKCFAGITFFIWLRATLPRLRYDQLMSLGWKTLLPVGVANFLVVGVWIVGTSAFGPTGGWASAALAILLVAALYMSLMSKLSEKDTMGRQKRSVTLVDPGSERRGVRMVDPKLPS